MDYAVDTARGKAPSSGLFRVVGVNTDIDDTREDVWEAGGTYAFPPDGGVQMRVVSSSAADAAAGTGIRTMDIHYLDANGVERTETVTLNGVTPVNTVATNILRIQDFHTKTVGSGGVAAGNISLTDVAGNVTYAYIASKGNRARQAVWTVPAGKRAFITEIWLGGNTDGATSNYIEGFLRATCDVGGTELLPGVFLFKWGMIATNDTVGGVLGAPISLPPLCDVKFSAISRAGTSNVRAVAAFAGWFEPVC